MYGLIVVPRSMEMRIFSSPWYLSFREASIVESRSKVEIGAELPASTTLEANHINLNNLQGEALTELTGARWQLTGDDVRMNVCR